MMIKVNLANLCAVGSAVTVMSGSQCISTLMGLRMGMLLGLKPRLIFAVQVTIPLANTQIVSPTLL